MSSAVSSCGNDLPPTFSSPSLNQHLVTLMANGPNMGDMFNKMMNMQNKINAAQDELAKKTTTAEAGGGMVKVTANGAQKITAIEIDKALEEAGDMAQEEMRNSMSGMLPPGMDLSQLGL